MTSQGTEPEFEKPVTAESEDDFANLNDFLLFDANIPNQDIEYLGSDKVKQLAQLFCQQLKSEYSDFSNLSTNQQQQKLHKLKGAAIGLGLVRLHLLCHQLEVNCQNKKLNNHQLLMLQDLTAKSIIVLNKYSLSL